MSDDVFTDQGGATNALEELVGDGKKFADNEALAIGKKKSDDFIETLKAEKQAVEDELAALKGKATTDNTAADLLAELRKSQTPTDDGHQAQSEEDFQERVRTIIAGDRETDNRKLNRELANDLVLQRLDGDEVAAKAYVADRARALGTTVLRLGELSEQSPKAFAQLMDINSTSTPSKGTASLQGQMAPHGGPGAVVLEVDGHKTKAYYDAQKKEMGHVKWVNDSRLQTSMAKDMSALGDRFNS